MVVIKPQAAHAVLVEASSIGRSIRRRVLDGRLKGRHGIDDLSCGIGVGLKKGIKPRSQERVVLGDGDLLGSDGGGTLADRGRGVVDGCFWA